MCLYFSTGRRFTNVDSRQARSAVCALACPAPQPVLTSAPPAAPCTLLAAPRNLEQRSLCCEWGPERKAHPRSAVQTSAAPQARGKRPEPKQRGASPSPWTPPLCPPRAQGPAACLSRSASCCWGHCSPGPTPAAAPQCTLNRRFAMQT